jgi:Protein of unknown function (DUF3305)
MTRPSITVAVVMERVAQPNRWEEWQHRVVEVVAHEGSFGAAPSCLRDDGKVSHWMHPGLVVELAADECKGYFLNLTSGAPVWFVPWRRDDVDASVARPVAVSLSYIVADRWLSAEEKVDTLPLPAELCEWLRVYTNEHFVPDGARKQRAQSFLSPEERERQARALRDGAGRG